MSALTLKVTMLSRIEQPKPSRRRIAPNVVRMFDDDRPAVEHPRRRGRYPSIVKVLARHERLRPGDLAEFVDRSPRCANFGLRVTVESVGEDGNVRFRCVDRMAVGVVDGTQRESWAGLCESRLLRRVWRDPRSRA